MQFSPIHEFFRRIENLSSYLSMLTATKFKTEAIPKSISTYELSLHRDASLFQVIAK